MPSKFPGEGGRMAAWCRRRERLPASAGAGMEAGGEAEQASGLVPVEVESGLEGAGEVAEGGLVPRRTGMVSQSIWVGWPTSCAPRVLVSRGYR